MVSRNIGTSHARKPPLLQPRQGRCPDLLYLNALHPPNFVHEIRRKILSTWTETPSRHPHGALCSGYAYVKWQIQTWHHWNTLEAPVLVF